MTSGFRCSVLYAAGLVFPLRNVSVVKMSFTTLYICVHTKGVITLYLNGRGCCHVAG